MTEPSGSTLTGVRAAVLAWYARERRDFPWRGTRDPYAVLVSEVMLQQTQAARVAPRFVRFLARFPTAASLAAASTPDVLAEWNGLGYNRRALSLKRTAAIVARDGWPRDVTALQRLPGVGPYTARALASLAFGTPVGVVDTNVRRWLLRRFGGPDQPRHLQALADALAAPGRAEQVPRWTHATMELGAAVCTARAPRCAACPLSGSCPSRDAAQPVPVPRQPRLRGSDRAYRGAIVRRLSLDPAGAVAAAEMRARLSADAALGAGLDDSRWERLLAALEHEGLIHRSRAGLRLGAARIAP